MKRDNRVPHFFTGVEVENVPTRGRLTLFCCGPVTETQIAEAVNCTPEICAIYLAANQSYRQQSPSYWALLAKTVRDSYSMPVIVDIGPDYWADIVAELPLGSGPAGITIVLSIDMPHAEDWAHRVHVKVDCSVTGERTVNKGVWVEPLAQLMSDENFTPWSAYTEDKIL